MNDPFADLLSSPAPVAPLPSQGINNNVLKPQSQLQSNMLANKIPLNPPSSNNVFNMNTMSSNLPTNQGYQQKPLGKH